MQCNRLAVHQRERLSVGLFWAVLIAALLLGASPLRAEDRSPTLLRAALVVKDAATSLRFYGLLGYRIESDSTTPRNPKENPFPLNAPSTQTRLVIIESATGAGGRIGLVEFSAPTPPAVRADPRHVGRGDVVLVFDVADADAVHARLRNAGADILEVPQIYVSRRTTDDGRPMRGKVFHAYDPDGYLVELLQPPSP